MTYADSEQAVLEALLEALVPLSGAEHAVALLTGPDAGIAVLAHRGMPAGHPDKMPHLPRPVGLLGHVLAGNTVRTEDMRTHPQAVGTPFGHFVMKALLGVPLSVQGRVLGGLWLTKGEHAAPFSTDDQVRAEALAQQAGAVLSALRERATAQALIAHLGAPEQREQDPFAPGAPSPAVRRLVHQARELLGAQVLFLGRIHGGRQTYTVVDVDEHAALPPRIREGEEIAVEQTYCSMLLTGELPAVVANARVHPLTSALAITAEVGIGAYCGVPVTLPGGTVWGTLCGLNSQAGTPWSASQVQALATIATLIGKALHESRQLSAQRESELATFAGLLSGQRRRTVVQPIVELASGATCGYEVLSRFSDTTGAPLRPDHVFATAARLGIQLTLEHAAVTSALQLVPDLPAGTYLSVNLSPRTIVHPATYDLLRAHPLQQVVVEMTEHEQITDYPSITNALDALRARGARLAIDDTGAGFAGLQHLARLRPDIVKLDMSFVHGIDQDPTLRAVARAVASFAAEVGAALVAEGIEKHAELTQLRALGATHGQGYLLGRPDSPRFHNAVRDRAVLAR